MDKKALDNAIYSTYTKYSDLSAGYTHKEGFKQATGAMQQYMTLGNPTYFSNYNNGRKELIANVSRDEMASYLADFLFRKAMSGESDDKRVVDLYNEIVLDDLDRSEEEIIDDLKQCMLGRKASFKGIDPYLIAEMVSQEYAKDLIQEKRKQEQRIVREAVRNVNPQYGIRNVRINSDLINICREEVLSGKQIRIQNDIANSQSNVRPRREYNLNDELTAVTDIGRARSEQQDSVLILYHPKNHKYKMLVVADGVGGHLSGDKASQTIVKEMVKWFEGLDPEIMLAGNEDFLQMAWADKLNQINDQVNDNYTNSGSTFVGAIVGEKNTTIASVGDSRGYILGKDNELYQLTDDDNIAYKVWKSKWTRYEKEHGELGTYNEAQKKKEKDSLRFRKDTNVIIDCIGCGKEGPVGIDFSRISNDEYRTLMLFSDGVTDCLSDDQILSITRSTNPKALASAIVNNAINNDSYRMDLVGEEDYKTKISGGKDNTSAVIYDNER